MMQSICHFALAWQRGRSAVLAALLALLATACGSREPEEAQQNDPMMMFPSEPILEASSAAPATAQNDFSEKDLEGLNLLLRDYVRITQKVPNDLNELVSSGFVSSLPSAPPGKRFVILLHPLGYQVALVHQ